MPPVGAWPLLLACAGIMTAILTACAALPSTSRTGTVYDIIISDRLDPQDVEVQPGDEVRWVNRRTAPAWVYFFREPSHALSCQRGFSYFWGTEEVAKVEPNQSASLCFARPGRVGYSVQQERTQVGGGPGGAPTTVRGSLSGAILVGSRPAP